MRIAFTRGAARDTVSIVRSDDSGAAFEFPHKGPPPHDAYHYFVERELGLGHGFWGFVAHGLDPEAVAARLGAQPDVEYAQARYRARPLFTPNDPLYRLQWNFPVIDMERAWDINPGGTTAVTVAVTVHLDVKTT